MSDSMSRTPSKSKVNPRTAPPIESPGQLLDGPAIHQRHGDDLLGEHVERIAG
jgi:hypothetical protein